MLPYIIVFTLSTLLLYLSSRTKNNAFKRIIVAIALLLPCFLAGARSLNVGTDTGAYKTLYDTALQSTSFAEYLEMPAIGSRGVNDFEIGFTFFLYIAKIFNNFNITLFFIELLMILPIYLGCKKNEHLADKTWLCMLLYYLLFYNTGLNAVREFVALSIVFYAVLTLLEKKENNIVKFLLLIVLATSFHKSAIISIAYLPIYYISETRESYIKIGKRKIRSSTIKALLLLIVSFSLILFTGLVDRLISIEGFERFSVYYSSQIRIPLVEIIRLLPMIIISILFTKNILKEHPESKFYIISFYYSIIVLSTLGAGTKYGGRISDVFKIINVAFFPLLATIPKTKRGRNMVIIYMICYAVISWWLLYVNKGYSETIPYTFGI